MFITPNGIRAFIIRHWFCAYGVPDDAWRHGVHFAAFPASILRPLMFVYCPEYIRVSSPSCHLSCSRDSHRETPRLFVYCPECHSGIFVFPPSVLLSRFPSREIPAFTPYTFHSTPEKSPQKAILFAYMQKKLYLCALKLYLYGKEKDNI